MPAPEPETFHFDDWRFDARDGRLVGVDREISLRPKTAGVLRELLVHAGEVVGKHELITTVWAQAGAGDDALAVCVNELRRALGDDPRHPRYIATAHRRGYRFVGTLVDVRAGRETSRALVGRERELGVLHEWWDAAGARGRRIGIVSGELGIGKSVLVRTLVDEVRAAGGAWIGEGQCVGRFGEGDPYHPFLDALNGICAGPRGARARSVLAARAPSWVAQLSGQTGPPRASELRSGAAGSTGGRMLREFVDAMAALAADAPVLLVCEDLHAGDRASLDLVAALAERGTPAGLLVVATVRTDASAGDGHEADLPDRLGGLGDSGFLPLRHLDAAAVRRYLQDRLGASAADDALAAEVLGRTGGNPLYLAMLTDHLAARGVEAGLAAADGAIPDGLRRVVERRIDALPAADRRVLETAAVAGAEFAAAAVAAALERTAGEQGVDGDLDRLVHTQGMLHELEPATWPDGTITARYAFTHSLHRDVLASRIGGARRVVAHRAIGERLAAAFAAGPGPAAAEIAEHFECGRDGASAAVWFAHAAETALGRQVPIVALAHTDRALANLDALRAADGESTYVDARSVALEARLRITRVAAAIVTWGVRSDRVAEEAARLDVASTRIEEPSALGRIGYVLWSVALMRGDLHAAEEPLGRLASAAARSGDAGLCLQSANAQAVTTLALGDPVGARLHIERAREFDSPEVRRRLAGAYQDSGVLLRTFAALDEWLLGETDEARRSADEALRLARSGSRPDGLAQALGALSALHQLFGEVGSVRVLAEELRVLAEAHELPLWISASRVMGGWGLIEQAPSDAVDRIRSGLAEVESVADGIWGPYHLSLLAEAETAAGRVPQAIEVVERATGLAEASGEVWYLAELIRMRGELEFTVALDSGPGVRAVRERRADDLLARSLRLARDQGARALERRTLATIAAYDLDRRRTVRWLQERSGA